MATNGNIYCLGIITGLLIGTLIFYVYGDMNNNSESNLNETNNQQINYYNLFYGGCYIKKEPQPDCGRDYYYFNGVCNHFLTVKEVPLCLNYSVTGECFEWRKYL